MVDVIKKRYDPEELFVHLERYVNVGSPSGFSQIHTPSETTSAMGEAKSFHMGVVNVDDDTEVHEFGTAPSFLPASCTFLHPDMFGIELFENVSIDKGPEVVPTSSERTVKSIENDGWFFKLTYRGLIGRVERQIARAHASSAIEVSRIICDAITKKDLPDEFMMFPETYGRVYEFKTKCESYDWGFVMREPRPHTTRSNIKYIVPAFSLFSPDTKKPTDCLLIEQMIRSSRLSAEEFVFERLIRPVLDCYFGALLKRALQLEAHAQNVLFALDDKLNVLGVVFRDAESIDKDLSLAVDLNLSQKFEDNSYKSLIREQYNYQIMHSFMYDFKLGEYLISPILAAASAKFAIDTKRTELRIRDHAIQHIKNLPDDFFPADNQWFSYGNIVHDRTRERPYAAKKNPKYR